MLITFSEISNNTGSINKTINADGSKSPNAEVYSAKGRTVKMPLSDFKTYLELISTQPEKAVILGVTGLDEFEIVKSGKETGNQIARTKEYFSYCNSNQIGLILLDIDSGTSHGPWNQTEVDLFISRLYELLEFCLIGENKSFDICRFERESSTAAVYKDGKPVGNGYHIYLPVKNPSEKLVELIFQWSFLSGYQAHHVGESGAVYERSIIDKAVRTPNRLVFESDCTVASDEFEIKFRECKFVPGGVIDAERAEIELSKAVERFVEDSLVTGSEVKSFNNIKEKYLAPIKRQPEVIEKVKAYKSRETDKLASKHKISKAAARAIVERRSAGVITSSDYITLNDGTDVPVYAILIEPGKWDGRSDLRTPFEPEYGKSKAKVFVNDNGSVIINSFAHGGCVFHLKFDYIGLKQWIESTDSEEVRYSYHEMVVDSILDEDEKDQIIDLLRERLKLKTPSIKKKISEATKKVAESIAFDGELPTVEANATHFQIAQHVLREFGDDYVVYGGSLYRFDKTIWNYKTGAELAYKIASSYGHCSRCVKDADYKSILRTLLEIVAPHKGFREEWEQELGVPCANFFWKFDIENKTIGPVPFTKEIGARYKIGFEPDFNMATPLFDKLLKNVVNPECLQKMLGLTLCGVMTKVLQKVGVMKGVGGAGKGTIFRILKSMLPKNQVTTMTLREFNQPKSRSKLVNAVVAEIPEADEGDREINLNGFKSATGGDSMTLKFLYKDEFGFTPTTSYLLSMNHWPRINSFHAEISRRLDSFIVEFKQNHGEDVVLLLDQKIIKHELPGVLAWMINGVRMWFEDDSKDPRSQELFNEWRNSVDTIAEFFDACCELAPNLHVKASDLHKKYLGFCLEKGIEAVSNQVLYRWFESAGCAKKRAKDTNYIQGIQLRR